jgi:DNA-binding MarR family transcriptional regulator
MTTRSHATEETTRWLSDREQCLWRNWLTAGHSIDAGLARQMQQDNAISMADYMVLVNLSEAPDHRMRVAALADRLQWDRSRLSHQITRMRNRGLLDRETCSSDGRGAFIVLTEDGFAVIRDAAPGHVAAVRAMLFDILSDEQQEQLADILHTVNAQFEAPAPDTED